MWRNDKTVSFVTLLSVAVLSVAILFGTVSCSKAPEEEAAPETEETAQPEEAVQEEETGRVIGISKIVQHPALDAVEQGIMDELDALGYSDITYDLQNANGDISTAASIANKFKSDRVDLAVGIATPTAQALVNAITDIPVVLSAVTDPVGAGLVSGLDAGEGNVTGVSDLTPVETQFDLIVDLVDPQVVGHVYASGEANAVTLAEMAKEASAQRGLEFVESTVVNSSEVRSATQSIVDRVDVIYVSTDNTVVSALTALTDVALANGVPVVSADATSAEGTGVLAALGFDYYKHGRATGGVVADILNGTDPASIPTLFMTDPSQLNLFLNLDVAGELGVNVSDEVMEDAAIVFEDGELRR